MFRASTWERIWVFKHFISDRSYRYEDLVCGHASRFIHETQKNPNEDNSAFPFFHLSL